MRLDSLFRARNTVPRDGTGWNPADTSPRGNTGRPQMENILRRGLLDDSGKKEFIQFVQNHDFNDPQVKRMAGFPPQFQIGNDAIKTQILTTTNISNAAVPYAAPPAAMQNHSSSLGLSSSARINAGKVLSDGSKLEIQNGELVRVNAQGVVMDAPDSVLKPLDMKDTKLKPFLDAIVSVPSDAVALDRHLGIDQPNFWARSRSGFGSRHFGSGKR